MKKIISLLLSLTMFLSIFPINVFATNYSKEESKDLSVLNQQISNITVNEEVYQNTNSVIFDVYSPVFDTDIPIDYEWGMFTLKEIEKIKSDFSILMIQIAAFYYPELVNLLNDDQILEMLDWNEQDIYTNLSSLSQKEIQSLNKFTPIVTEQFELHKNPNKIKEIQNDRIKNKKINKSVNEEVYGEYPNNDVNLNFSIIDSTNPVIDEVYGKNDVNLDESNFPITVGEMTVNSELTNPYAFRESNNNFQYRVNTEDAVDPLYKVSNQRDIDLSLPGRQGLDFSLIRSYNSLNAKVITPFYDTLYEYRYYVDNSDYDLWGYGISDFMGNWPYRAIDDIYDNPNFVAIGWELNLPYMKEGNIMPIESTTTSQHLDYYNRNHSESISNITFSLDDGSSYEFRDGNSTPYNHPYSNVRYYKESGKTYLVINEQVTYEFDDKGRILSKSNYLGAKIMYQHQTDKILVTDSVNRIIEIYKNNGRITGFNVKDSQGIVTHQITYEVVYNEHNALIRTFNPNLLEYEYNLIDADYYSLNRVVDSLANKTLKTYTYYEPRVADYNFEDDYYYTTDENYDPILDYWVDSNGVGAEAIPIIERDLATYGEIEYLLLNEVIDNIGFTMQYQYRSYDYSWDIETNYYSRDYGRGTTRLYMDPWAISYIGYHPVTSVYYKYSNVNREEKILKQSFLYISNNIQEIWQYPRHDGEYGDFRLSNSRTIRKGGDPETIYSIDYGDYEVKHYDYYRPINHGLMVKKYEFNHLNNGDPQIENGIYVVEGDTEYKFATQEMTSYQYDPGKTKPFLTKGFDIGATNDPKNNLTEIRNFLWQGDNRTYPSNLENYATLYKTEYDSFGFIIYQEDPYGNKIEITYGGPNHQISKLKNTSFDGQSIYEEIYVYNMDATISKVTKINTYRNPSNISEVWQDTIVTEYLEYNSYKLPTSVRETSSGHQFGKQPIETNTNLQYDSQGLHVMKETSQITLVEGGTSTPLSVAYSYDNRNRLTIKTFPDNSKVEYQYDYKDRITSETFTPSPSNSGTNRQTTYVYDDINRKITETMPDGEKTITYYTPYGDIEMQQRQSGNNLQTVLVNRTNKKGKLIVATQPYGDLTRETQYLYGVNGEIQTVTNPLGLQTNYYYSNAAHRTDGSSTHLQDTIRVVEPDGKEVWTYKDYTGRVLKQKEKSATKLRTTEFTYTPLGNVAQKKVIANGNSQITQYGYDGMGNLIYLKDNLGQTYQYVYNRFGQVIATYVDGKLQKEKLYNQAGWVLKEADASGLQEKYNYQINGMVNQYIDRKGQTFNYTYTPYYEEKRISVLDTTGKEVYWLENSYDNTTRLLTGISNSEGETINYHYDDWKRLDKQTILGRNYTLGYDEYDRLISIIYPDQEEITYSYDNIDRIQNVYNSAMGNVSYTYSVAANENKVVTNYSNGLTQEYIIDAFKELVSTNHYLNNTTANWTETLGYDGFGNITNLQRNGTNYSFTYDNLNRIKEENLPTGQNSYTYDAQGNRSTLSTTEPLNLQSNITYTYNALNQLQTYNNNGIEAVYTYYGNGLRATKEINGQLTRYVYLNGKVIEELDSNGNVKARNIWGDKLLYRKDVQYGKDGYYFYNGHGDVVKIIDRNGNTINTYDYDIWGNITSQTENMSNPFKYAGEIYDEETGYYYLRARYYDPSIGRFINEDKYEGDITNPLSLNYYTYVYNNPIRYIDTTGNAAEDVTRQLARWIIANPAAVWVTQNPGWTGEKLFNAAGFVRDSSDVYHTRQDALQQYGGYNFIYDIVFDYATNMKPQYFQFTYNDQDYRFWAWKGDYLNLGAGAELGIYTRMSVFGEQIDHWLVDTSLALPMTMTLSDNNGNLIASYNPSEPQWWITSFNSYYQGVNADNLRATFTVDFSGNTSMFDAFYKQWGGKKDSPWIFDKKNHTGTLNF